MFEDLHHHFTHHVVVINDQNGFESSSERVRHVYLSRRKVVVSNLEEPLSQNCADRWLRVDNEFLDVYFQLLRSTSRAVTSGRFPGRSDGRALQKQVDRNVEPFRQLLRLRLTDGALPTHHLECDASRTEHVQQISLPKPVFFHQAQESTMGCRTFEGVVGLFERFDQHAQEPGVFAFLGRELVIAAVEVAQLGDELSASSTL